MECQDGTMEQKTEREMQPAMQRYLKEHVAVASKWEVCTTLPHSKRKAGRGAVDT